MGGGDCEQLLDGLSGCAKWAVNDELQTASEPYKIFTQHSTHGHRRVRGGEAQCVNTDTRDPRLVCELVS